jgi:4-aminobutyrate aminotransferase
MNRDTAVPSIKKPPPGPNSRKWTKYHMTFSTRGIYFHDFVWDRSKPAIGPFCSDPDGNLILDFSSHGLAFPLGYNNPELIEMATKAAEVNPDRYGAEIVAAWGGDPEKAGIPTASHLIHKLASITERFGLDRFFLSSSGAEAVENALKICFAHRKNMGIGFYFQRAFHGRTLGAASLTKSRRAQSAWYPQVPQTIELPYCHCSGECRCGWKVSPVRFRGEMSRLAELLDSEIGVVDPEQVAFVILEPIQGEGGYNIPSLEFIQEVASLTKEHHIPLIVDEIQSGLGRTGKWFAFEHFGIVPDLIALGKTLRVGATVARNELAPDQAGRLGGTWSGTNAVASAVGYRVLEIIERDNLLDHATTVGAHLLDGLESLAEEYPIIVDTRGLGLMVAITVDGSRMASQLVQQALNRGLLLFTCGFDSIRFMPPLDVTIREVDLALEILDDALATLS